MVHNSYILASLHERSLLDLAPQLKEVLLEHGIIRLYPAGEKLCDQGKPLEFLIIPLSEGLILRQGDQNTEQPKPLGYLQKSRSLCLYQLLENLSAPYTAITQIPTSVLCVPTNVFLEFVQRQPKLFHYLKLMTKSRAARHLKECLKDKGVAHEDLLSFFSLGFNQIFESSEKLSLDLQKPTLYIIERGAVCVESLPDSQMVYSTHLEAGSWFGGEGVVAPYQYRYTATVVEPAQLRSLPLVSAQRLIEKWQLVDWFFSEPWIIKTRVSSLRKIPNSGAATADMEKTLNKLGYFLDYKRLAWVSKDEESAAATVANLTLLLDLPMDFVRCLKELRIQGRVTFRTLSEVLEPWGLRCCVGQCSGKGLKLQNFPCLVFFGPRLSILLAYKKGKVLLLDSVEGLVTLPAEKFFEQWDGFLMAIQKSSEPEAVGRLQFMFAASLRCRPWIRFQSVLLAIGVGAVFTFPSLIKFVVDSIVVLPHAEILWVIIFFVVLGGTVAGAVYWETACRSKLRNYLRGASFSSVFPSLPGLCSNQGDSETNSRWLHHHLNSSSWFSDVSLLKKGIWIGFFLGFINLAMFRWYYGLIGIGFSIATGFVNGFFQSERNWLQERFSDLSRQAQEWLGHQISASITFKALGIQRWAREKWEEKLVKIEPLRLRLHSIELDRRMIHQFIFAFSQGSVLFCWLRFTDRSSLGECVGAVVSLAMLSVPMLRLRSLQEKEKRIGLPLENDSEFPRKGGVPHRVHPLALSGKIKMDRVFYRYSPDVRWTLSEFSLTIYPGQFVAIVGRSGAGKTTLTKLLGGLLQPSSGAIYFDDFDRNEISPSCLSRQIGMVLQEPRLFTGSLSENIAYGDDSPDERKIKSACQIVEAENFIEKLPNQLETFLPCGVGLSSGQRQRIFLAQGYYLDPKIWILDEPFSYLDMASEKAVLWQLLRVKKGKTLVMATHKLSGLHRADKIFVLKDGAVVEEGTHSALLDRAGHYYELYKEQLLAGEL